MQVRQSWPQLLEAVKHRRRFTWILLSQNAQVVGFDGTTLHLAFGNSGARDSFINGGSDDVLRQAVADVFGVEWRIEAIVDPSGKADTPPTGPSAVAVSHATRASGPPGAGPAPGAAATPERSAASRAEHQPAAVPVRPSGAARLSASEAPPAPPVMPPGYSSTPVSPEDDIPEDDDPDLIDSALSGRELLIRELGATVIEEIQND